MVAVAVVGAFVAMAVEVSEVPSAVEAVVLVAGASVVVAFQSTGSV